MKSIDIRTQRTINGGCSKNVYCPVCGKKIKVSWIQRLFWSNSRVRAWAQSEHGLNMMYGSSVNH